MSSSVTTRRAVGLLAGAVVVRFGFSAWWNPSAAWALIADARPVTVIAGLAVGLAIAALAVGLVIAFQRLLDQPRATGWVVWLLVTTASMLVLSRAAAVVLALTLGLATLTGPWGRLGARLATVALAIVCLAASADQWPAAGRVSYAAGGEHYGRVLDVGAETVTFLDQTDPPSISVESVRRADYHGLESCPRPWPLRPVIDLSGTPDVDTCNG